MNIIRHTANIIFTSAFNTYRNILYPSKTYGGVSGMQESNLLPHASNARMQPSTPIPEVAELYIESLPRSTDTICPVC
jgi:hypothetical protein